MEDQNKSNEEDYLNAITKDKKVAKDKKSDNVSKTELKKKEKEEKKKAKKEGKKHEKGLVIAVVILAVLLALALPGAILFIVALCNSNPFAARAVITEQHAESTVVDDECESYECDEETVEKVLKRIREEFEEGELDSRNSEIHYNTNGKDTDSGLYHKINDDGTLYPLDWSLVLGYYFDETKTSDFEERAVKTLLDIGFIKYDTNDIKYDTIEADSYINGEIICQVTKSSVECGNDKQKRGDEGEVVQLVEAYKKSTGKVLKRIVNFSLDSQLNNNIDENGYGYRTGGFGADDSEGTYRFYFFYEKIKENETPQGWVYAYRSEPPAPGDPYIHFSCSVFEDNNIRNAYSIDGGVWCDNENGERVELKF